MAQLNREVLFKKYGIANLFNLNHIDFFLCQITNIDRNTFQGLVNLQTLWLGFNAINEIDTRLFESLSNLKELDLQYNILKRIYFNNLKRLTKLETLWLSGNEIEEIGLRTFESLSNLKALYLNYNKLKRIESNTFKNLTQLVTLNLSYNEIEEIDVRLFETLSNLKVLLLSNNKLKEIDSKCFDPLESIEVIEIYENVDLNAISFISPSTKYWYNNHNVKKYGSISEWNTFLQQFHQQDQDLFIGLLLNHRNHRYEVKRKIGSGAFGSVYLVDETTINIKEVKKKAMKIMDQLNSVTDNEIDLLSEINHDNILKYFDHFHKKIGGENKTFLITEYCENGDLRNKIKSTRRLNRNFDDIQILNWITQSTNALNYLHSKKPDPIIHRDIKPANMFLNGRNEIKIGDLGISKLMEKTHASTYVGTKDYMSPEVFNAQLSDIKYYPNTDIWSLGCVLYELIFLTKAFPNGQRNDPPIPKVSGTFSTVLSKMLEKDCLVRITSQQLLTELENLYNEFMFKFINNNFI